MNFVFIFTYVAIAISVSFALQKGNLGTLPQAAYYRYFLDKVEEGKQNSKRGKYKQVHLHGI